MCVCTYIHTYISGELFIHILVYTDSVKRKCTNEQIAMETKVKYFVCIPFALIMDGKRRGMEFTSFPVTSNLQFFVILCIGDLINARWATWDVPKL